MDRFPNGSFHVCQGSVIILHWSPPSPTPGPLVSLISPFIRALKWQTHTANLHHLPCTKHSPLTSPFSLYIVSKLSGNPIGVSSKTHLTSFDSSACLPYTTLEALAQGQGQQSLRNCRQLPPFSPLQSVLTTQAEWALLSLLLKILQWLSSHCM